MLPALVLRSGMADLLRDRLAAGLIAACLLLALPATLGRRLAPPARLTIEQPTISVAIDGLVVNPGLYQVAFGARVADLVELAGGFQAGAAKSLVALADPLTDGEAIYIPSTAIPAGVTRVSVNSASVPELLTLPGIGPVMAERLIAHRPYSRVDDLLRVPGIGPATFERLRHHVAL